jgi:hypothetical protein
MRVRVAFGVPEGEKGVGAPSAAESRMTYKSLSHFKSGGSAIQARQTLLRHRSG